MIHPNNKNTVTKGVFRMKTINPIKTELYVEPEIQDITPVSVVKGVVEESNVESGGDESGGVQE